MVLITADENRIKERLEKGRSSDNPSEATFTYYLDRKKHFEPVRGEYVVVDNSGDLEMFKERLLSVAA